MKLYPNIIPLTNINFKWIKDLNIRPEIGGKFWAITSKAKINKWNYIKLKSFYRAKQIIDKMKMQPIQWEDICKSHMC